jgi:seryl-tRNA synthetase
MVTRKTTGQQVSQPTTESLELDLSKLNDKAIATLLATARAESTRRAKEKKANENARKEAERIAEKQRKEDEEHQKARDVNTRLTQIRTTLDELEKEVETLISSVDHNIVYVGFTHRFGEVSSSYNNVSTYWSSSYN